jgi:hypothetical protein
VSETTPTAGGPIHAAAGIPDASNGAARDGVRLLFGNILHMRALLVASILLAVPTAAFAPVGPAPPPPSRVDNVTVQPEGVAVRFDSGDTASFRVAERLVTDIDFHVQGKDYSLPLTCAGGVADVHFDTAELSVGQSEIATERSFTLRFEIGQEQDRKFGALPRITVGFRRGRVVAITATNKTGETGDLTSPLCADLPVGRITCKDTRLLQGLDPEALVQQLRLLPPVLQGTGPLTTEEKKRESIYEELLGWGAASVPPLVEALRDPDVSVRRNATLAFGALGGGWWQFECGTARLDISSALPSLVAAFKDADSSVRGWAAQAVGDIGESAASAVPALIGLLHGDEGSRNSACIALGNIGPAAKAALPALHRALHDSSPYVQKFAARAIEKIER